ncbi:SusC/RagA family TonB-linked outer membrane protein [Changchengzhania lutea]|uniref:SusC/RagA family TonB-linked outer membrane protein n=1 Tax=Changchengzhania lutea TaxID=2049305 RepID=UPI001FE39F23|nr:TonB-dependent receptor [Changchengzhania lutea]
MEIKLINVRYFIRKRLLLMIMKTFVLLLCTTVYSFTTEKSFSQEKVIIDKDQLVTVDQVFRIIKQQTDYRFIYPKDLFKNTSKVQLKKGEIKITKLLKQSLSDNYFVFVLTKKNEIVVEEKTVINDSKQQVQQKINGTVVDANNVPLLGASVLVKGTTVGTVTDFDGNFELSLPNDANTLIVSYIGFKTQEVDITNKTTVSIILLADAASLDEVVVVGYGTLAKKRVSGSVASVSSKDIADIPVVSLENAIIGQVAGVQVQETTGEPGASPTIRIRGTGSISAGNDPLFVVDGIPISKNVTSVGIQGELARRAGRFQEPAANPLATINPNDIASIEILKDASAAAIYGSRGGNGVVIITTKKGTTTDEGAFSFNSFVGVQTLANKINLMNSQELIDYTRDARNNNYLSSVPSASINDPIGPGDRGDTNYEMPESFLNWDGTDTDWQDLIFDSGIVQSYNLSYASPVKNKSSFFVSGGYYNQEGIVDGSQYERYNALLNLNSQLTEKLNLDIRLAPAVTDNQRKPVNAPYFARPPGIVYSALVHSPTVKPYNADGSINQTDNQSFLGGGTTTASNPLAIIQSVDDRLFQFQTRASLGLSYDILPELTFKTFAGTYINVFNRDFFRDNSLLYRNAAEGESYAQAASSTEVNWLWENTLNWEKEIGDHYFNAIMGYTVQKDEVNIKQVQADNFPDDLVPTISGGQVFAGTSVKEEWSLVSALFRLNYSFKDKYLFTGTIRTDKSSRFGTNNKTGYFPSFSLGWRVSEEDFLSSIESISELKIRASWGQTGNFEIPNFGAIGLLSPDNYNFNGNEVNGLVQSTIPNPELTWEKSTQTDVGIELGMFNNRLFLLADYYSTTTEDLLLNVSISSVSGFNTALQNLGEVRNRGFELALRSRNFVGDFTWDTDINFSTNDNEVISLNEKNEPIFSAGGAGVRHVTRVGDAIGSYYGYVVEGIYQTQAEIDSAPFDTQAPNPAPGDFRFKDVDGDGQITPDDRTVTGSYFPDFTWGITNRFGYKDFDLSILVQGVEGNEILNLTSRHLKNGEANFNSYAIFNQRWRSALEPGNGQIPRADRATGNHGNNNRPSSFQVEDGSFIRLRNITLGYTLPAKKLLGGSVDKLRIYLTGTNLFTDTDYLGYNPEVSNITGSLTPGEDYGAFPLTKTIALGFNLNF